jgi:hypothetical protein
MTSTSDTSRKSSTGANSPRDGWSSARLGSVGEPLELRDVERCCAHTRSESSLVLVPCPGSPAGPRVHRLSLPHSGCDQRRAQYTRPGDAADNRGVVGDSERSRCGGGTGCKRSRRAWRRPTPGRRSGPAWPQTLPQGYFACRWLLVKAPDLGAMVASASHSEFSRALANASPLSSQFSYCMLDTSRASLGSLGGSASAPGAPCHAQLTRADGSHVPVSLTRSIVPDADGCPMGAVVVMRNRSAEEAVEQHGPVSSGRLA